MDPVAVWVVTGVLCLIVGWFAGVVSALMHGVKIRKKMQADS
jgi:hypothetical protein